MLRVARVRRYANVVQYTAAGILVLTLCALAFGILTNTVYVGWWVILIVGVVLLGTLTVATLARRLARFAHIIVQIFR